MKIPDRLALALSLLLLAVPGIIGLTQWPLWRAEMWTWMLNGMPFADMWAKLAEDFHPPGYFGLTWLLFDDTTPDWLLRAPSLVGALGAVALVWWLARRWFGPAEALFAAVSLALSPFLIVWGGTARGYGLLTSAAAGMLVSAALLVDGKRVRTAAVGLFLASTAACYLHYAAAAAVVGTSLGIAAGLRARPDRGRGRWGWAVGAMVGVGVALLPWVAGPMRVQQVDVARIPRSLRALGYLVWPVGHHYPFANWLLLAAGVVGIAVLLRRRSPVDRLLLAWAACAVVIPLILSDRSDIQNKVYIQSWFLPAWGLYAGLGVAALVRFAPSFRIGAGVFGGVVGLSALWTLLALWRLPGAPFEMLNGSTVYDVRRERVLFESVLPAIPAGSVPTESFSLYTRYFGQIPTTAATPWRYRRRGDVQFRSVYGAEESGPCAFAHAFFVVLAVEDPVACEAIARGLEARADDDYPPFLLELAARERLRGNWDSAAALAARAGEIPAGWSDPTVLRAQLYAQSGQPDKALAEVEAGIEATIPWENFFVIKELYSMRAELLRALGRFDEATLAAQCAEPATRLESCPSSF